MTLLSLSSYAYELVIVQSISKEKQTFVTRNRPDHIYVLGQKATFTSSNVSLIARAKTVSREFTQWEILNDYTDVPFNRGEVVTIYEAQEYLWALSPEEIKRKHIKNSLFVPKRSFESRFAFTRGISESVTDTSPDDINRQGYFFEGNYRKEIDFNFIYSFGLRYTTDVINLSNTSLTNQRFMGMFDIRYYTEKIKDVFDSRLGISIGAGFGQSRTETNSQVSTGSAVILPTIRAHFDLPITKKYEFGIYGGIESIRIEETFVNNDEQTTNLNHSHFGIMLRTHLN